MVKIVQGDLFYGEVDILAHGCNCKNGFGSGVAGMMAKLHPSAKTSYHAKFFSEGWKPGDVQFVISNNKIIANCATQNDYYPRNKCHADYDAIWTSMEKVKAFAKLGNFSIGIPKIGAGLAGGDWDTIKGILNEVFQDYDVTVFCLD
jgi:O-acetyl-ADP-ribose deacetylase (regulator of RNase III)